MSKVPVQKGSIDPNPMTMKQQSRERVVAEAVHNQRELKRFQTLDLHTPRSSKGK